MGVKELKDVDIRLREMAKLFPEEVVLKDVSRSICWAEFDARVNQIANAMLARRISPNDRIAILGRNSLAYAQLMFGCLRAGACLAPLSGLVSAKDIVNMLADCGARYLFVGAEYADEMLAYRGDLMALDTDGIVLLDGHHENCPNLQTFIDDASTHAPIVPTSMSMGFNLIYSSGTTGVPKGILQDRRYRAQEVTDMIEGFAFDHNMRTLVSTPLYSNTTLFLFISTIAAGGSAFIMEKFSAEEFLKLSQIERITHAVLVPVQLMRILKEPRFESYDLSEYKRKFCTSAPLHAKLKLEILERWPAGGLSEFYGMTEGGVCCLLNAHENPDKLDTVGQPAMDCDLKIIDAVGKELPKGSVGEIIGRSTKMMVNYYKRADATMEASWFDGYGNRYHRSGDVGWIDDEGFLHLLDRTKDIIISGGFNVYAVDLESVLLEHPDIADAAVIAAPSEQWGETPVAFVVPHPGAAPELDQLQNWANAKLGKAQRISNICIIDDLPRSPIGKILKRVLRDQL